MENKKERRVSKSRLEEIDIYELLSNLWDDRRTVAKILLATLAIGLSIAFFSPIEYQATCKLIPENQEGIKSGLGNIGGLAGLAGINLEMESAGTLVPELYPEIAKSIPFLMKLLRTDVYFEELDIVLSPYAYFEQYHSPSIFSYIFKYTVGLPTTIKAVLSKDEAVVQERSRNILRLTKAETELTKDLIDRIDVRVNTKTGIISVTSEMPDAFAAADLTQQVVNYLTDEVVKYKTEKSIDNYEFVLQRFNESRKTFIERQEHLADFVDRNKNLNSAMAQTEHQRLLSEYNIAFEVYKGLATELEQAKIKVKEETPVFTIIEPVRVPNEKNKPKRMMILSISLIIGLCVGITVVLFSRTFKDKMSTRQL